MKRLAHNSCCPSCGCFFFSQLALCLVSRRQKYAAGCACLVLTCTKCSCGKRTQRNARVFVPFGWNNICCYISRLYSQRKAKGNIVLWRMYYLLHCCASSHHKSLHLKQMITLTFIGTPDSAPVGPPLPCRPFNKNVHIVVHNIGTIGRTRRRLRYQACITCPSTTSALFSLLQWGLCVRPMTRHCLVIFAACGASQ